MADPPVIHPPTVRARFGLRLPLLLARAVWLLAWGRVEMGRIPLARLAATDDSTTGPAGAGAPLTAADEVMIDVVSRLIPEVACWVPWRADCLVQSLAAQRWLAAEGIAARIEIGVNPAAPQGFASHAWLRCSTGVVVGGETAQYAVLLGHQRAEMPAKSDPD